MKYTQDEVVLCTYAALHNHEEFDINAIQTLTGRSADSIKMKIQNIAAMLDEEGIPRNPHISSLSGKPAGEGGRRTNWEIVKPLTQKQSRG
ncbi:MAG: hypothetical protein KY468_05875 [Armatimonadetes bacterium]|nr:hypothetical protein [Armatimonadota bacterium]